MAHTENCEGWLSPGGHSSGGRALMAKSEARVNPRWLPVFHSSLKIFLSLFIMYSVAVIHASAVQDRVNVCTGYPCAGV